MTDGAIINRARARVCNVAMAPTPLRRKRARRGETAASRIALLDVAAALHVALGLRLRVRQRLVGLGGAGQRGGKLLPDGGRNALEFGNRRELHADIGFW